jgi:hypothetical protein
MSHRKNSAIATNKPPEYPTVLGLGASQPSAPFWNPIQLTGVRFDHSRTFREREGYIVDQTDGGLHTCVSTPEVLAPQVEKAGMRMVDIVGGRYPDTASLYLTPWHYYVCEKAGTSLGSKA